MGTIVAVHADNVRMEKSVIILPGSVIKDACLGTRNRHVKWVLYVKVILICKSIMHKQDNVLFVYGNFSTTCVLSLTDTLTLQTNSSRTNMSKVRKFRITRLKISKTITGIVFLENSFQRKKGKTNF